MKFINLINQFSPNKVSMILFWQDENHVGNAQTFHSGPLCAAPGHTVTRLRGPPWTWRWWVQPRRRRLQPGVGRSALQTTACPEQWPQCRESSWGSCCRSNRRIHARLCLEPSWVWVWVWRRIRRIRWIWWIWRVWRRLWIPTIRRWLRLWPPPWLWARGLWWCGVLHRSIQWPNLQQHHCCHWLPNVPAHGPLGGIHVALETKLRFTNTPEKTLLSKITHPTVKGTFLKSQFTWNLSFQK